ncbi:MAG TPA: hypothetical protein VHW01_30765 [Polyangiaceae bacterium]|jgi:hypothetical protein|nr:hypothetical protein [Polyangiaceae bacterium]
MDKLGALQGYQDGDVEFELRVELRLLRQANSDLSKRFERLDHWMLFRDWG